VCALLICRKAADSCILILYPDTLQKEFMISSIFGEFLWLQDHVICK
jgi:hypothetical protein